MGVTSIAVLSLKGGTGKTTVTLGLAGAAAMSGRPAMVIDLDPQANASGALGITDPQLTISDALADGRRGVAADAVEHATWWSDDAFAPVRVLAAERALEHRASSFPGSSTRLRRVIDGVAAPHEIVFIDCPPTLGELTRNALVAADVALIVTDPSYFALSGAQQAIDAVDVVRHDANPRLGLAGIVVNRVRARSAEQSFRIDELNTTYPELILDPMLTERAGVPASQGAGAPIQAWRGSSAKAFSDSLDHLLASVLSRIETIHSTGAL